MARIQSISAFAAFKVGFAICGVLGAVAGVFCSAVAFAGVHLPHHPSLMGLLALLPLVVCPTAWGVVGGAAAAVTALLYNLASKCIGGLDVEIS
jgi:hypothetical protein